MGINNKIVEKYEKAYAGLPEIRGAIDFEPTSPYYHMEEWRDVLPRYVPGVLENTYKISTHGRVYSNLRSPQHPNGGIIAHSINARGYHQINLKTIDGGKTCTKIARLVLLHFRFVPRCHLLEVDHLDGNKDNNYIWNLEWVTSAVNTHRAIKNGQRRLANNCDYNGTNLLSPIDAEMMYIRAINSMYGLSSKIDPNTGHIEVEDLNDIANNYNVSLEYLFKLIKGFVRPRIKKRYNDMLEYCTANNKPLRLIK